MGKTVIIGALDYLTGMCIGIAVARCWGWTEDEVGTPLFVIVGILALIASSVMQANHPRGLRAQEGE